MNLEKMHYNPDADFVSHFLIRPLFENFIIYFCFLAFGLDDVDKVSSVIKRDGKGINRGS